MIGIFLGRCKKLDKLEFILGIIIVLTIFPVGFIMILNFTGSREWWTFVLPIPLLLFLIVELIFDYILKLDFRNTKLLWPYLVLYYLGLWGMIGYSFLINNIFGFITLGSYFLNLFATWYSYSKVGHGTGK